MNALDQEQDFIDVVELSKGVNVVQRRRRHELTIKMTERNRPIENSQVRMGKLLVAGLKYSGVQRLKLGRDHRLIKTSSPLVCCL